MWEVLNRERKRRKGIIEGIELEKWVRYFKDLLRGQGGERSERR